MNRKSGFVSIAGKPNSGKSTILNSVLGQEISVVTSKPQTTRNKVLGIYNNENIQIVFTDTPGILEPRYKLQSYMKKELESSFIEADIIILVVDGSKYAGSTVNDIYQKYKKEFAAHKIFCVINKIDLLKKENVLKIIDDLSKNFSFDEIIPLSGKTGFNIDELVKTIVRYLPEHDFYFDNDIVAAQPERFFAAEIIRAQALKLYKDEVPFSIYVEIEEFREREKGKSYIRAALILDKESQKPIVIGRNGSKIKLLGERSRKQIEEFTGYEVYLELYVKIRKNWRNDEEFLKKNFHSSGAPAN